MLAMLLSAGLLGAAEAADAARGWHGVGPVPWAGGEEQAAFSDGAVARARAQPGLDWVARGAVTTPISQGRCGTCAQFSATANIEGQWHLKGAALPPTPTPSPPPRLPRPSLPPPLPAPQ